MVGLASVPDVSSGTCDAHVADVLDESAAAGAALQRQPVPQPRLRGDVEAVPVALVVAEVVRRVWTFS